ncbi:MAG: 30S ribosomal protein S11 [Candidatus Dadabacteria bacterium]|nr:MAG: 30S ribosomal protein S11 [Candidatus Dadabacteria bacterium]
MAVRKGKSGGKKKTRKVVPHAVAHIHATFNNTIITLSDPDGGAVFWSSPGRVGFKGTRKSTPFAAQVAAEEVARQARDLGVESIEVNLKGAGMGREMALRALSAAGLKVTRIRDVTPVPHNGCRPPKRRRV